MEKPLLTLKANLKCAIIPVFMKSAVKMLPFGIVILALAFILKLSILADFSTRALIIASLAAFLVLALIPMKYRLMKLHFTKYHFYKTHVVAIFKFLRVKKNSLPYTQITNIKIHVSFWDRICGTGKIALNSSEKGAHSITLPYIKRPHEIEEKLQSLIHKYYEDTAGKEHIGN